MAISIGTVTSIGKAKSWSVTPDDRQTMVPVIDSPYNIVVDNGYHESGDVYTCSATFAVSDFVVLKGYWTGRTIVNVTTDSGETLASRRIVVRGWSYPNLFEKTYMDVSLELWAV